VFAQEPDGYRLRSIAWQIEGNTKPTAARYAAGILGNETWHDSVALDQWLQDVQKTLMSTRLFDRVSIHHEIEQASDPDIQHVDVNIELVDSRNLILLPRPKYDPNDGLELGLGLRDYNFLGSMQTLKFDLGLIAEGIGQPDAAPVRMFIDSEAMISGALAGLGWNMNLVQDLAVDSLLANQFGTIVGLGFDVPAGRLVLSVTGEQSFNFNHDIKQFYLMPDEDVSANTWFGASLVRIGATVPEHEIGRSGSLWRFSAGAGYTTGGAVATTQPWPGFIVVDQSAHSVSLDWSGNFRKGTSIAIVSTEIFDRSAGMWLADVVLDANLHYIFFPKLAFSARLYALHRSYDYAFEDGWLFRGVLDNALSARSLGALSLDGRAFVLSFLPSQWLHDERIAIFNFELQTSLFIDAGIGLGINGNHLYGTGDLVACAGIEVLIFPLAFKSAFLRLSLGKDMTTASGMFEPYLGLDLQY